MCKRCLVTVRKRCSLNNPVKRSLIYPYLYCLLISVYEKSRVSLKPPFFHGSETKPSLNWKVPVVSMSNWMTTLSEVFLLFFIEFFFLVYISHIFFFLIFLTSIWIIICTVNKWNLFFSHVNKKHCTFVIIRVYFYNKNMNHINVYSLNMK